MSLLMCNSKIVTLHCKRFPIQSPFSCGQDFPSMSDKYQMDNLTNAKADFQRQMILWMDRLHNHPSIVLWVVFNEGWGQFDTVNVTKKVMALDASR